jgi:hypothetical protein
MNSHTYLGVEINDTWSLAKLMPSEQLSKDDRAERYEAFVGDTRPYRHLVAGTLAEMPRLIRDAQRQVSCEAARNA